MQTMLHAAPNTPAVSIIAPLAGSAHAEPAEEASVPFHRSLLVRVWLVWVYSASLFDYINVHDTAPHHEPLWVYALLVLFWPLVPAVWVPVMREMINRYPFVRADRVRALRAHALALAGLTLFDLTYRPIFISFNPLPLPDSSSSLSWRIGADLIAYVVIAALFEIARATRRYRALEVARAALGVQVAEARRRRTEAELSALKAELNPHFLGNALASVAALLETDVRAADRTLAQIGELLGRLGRRGANEVTMAEELEGLEPVLEYERLRLSGRLTVERDLAGDARDALVPDMILHPLVENAVKYGLAPRGGGTLRIAAERIGAVGETLVISVRDEGLRDAPAGMRQSHGTGIGLANVRSRLTEIYGNRARLDLRPDGTRGMEARVTLPWRDETVAVVDQPPREDEDLGAGSAASAAARQRVPLRTHARGLAASGLRVALAVGVWFALVNLYVTSAARNALERSIATDPFGVVLDMSVTVTLRVALAIAALEITRRLSGRWASRSLLRLNLAVPIGFGLLGILNKVTIILAFTPARMHAMPWSHLFSNMAREILFTYMVYFIVVGATLAVLALWRTRWSHASRLRLHQRLEEERQRRAAAELRALESELNPHFVGNALGVVSSLIHTDRAAALCVLEELGTLLRAALSRAATHEVTLREELATLKSFLAVEHARLGRRLDIHWSVDEGALDGQVPHMILQPLVENAVKHGLAPRGQAGRIDVEARRGERELELVVRDDGVGLPLECATHDDRRKGVGLANTRARLSELYGPIARLELSSGEAGGTVARVRIPWRRVMDAEPALAI